MKKIRSEVPGKYLYHKKITKQNWIGIMNSKTERWPWVMIVILIGSVFLEGSGYSFQLLGMRIRSVQIFEVLFLGLLGMLSLFGKWRWQKSPLDFWLFTYLSINFIAIFNSSWQARSVKIFLLLCSLAFLYWLVYQLLRTVKDIFLAFYVFLAMGTLQVLFGLYQVLAGALNHYRGWRLPIGYMGTVHQEYINSVWGRPYGTQVEPDFYGAICMVFALIFIVLYFSKSGKIKKWLLAGTLLSLLGLYFSFVRGSWLVFLLLLPLLALCRKKISFFRFTWKSTLFIICVAVGAHVAAVNTIPPIKRICATRFATKIPAKIEISTVHQNLPATKIPAKIEKSSVPQNFPTGGKGNSSPLNDPKIAAKIEKSTVQQNLPAGGKDFGSLLNNQNVRLILIKISLRAWRENPVFGNGPGSFAYFYWKDRLGEVAAQKKIAAKAFPQTNPNMLFTVLGDTGLLGFIVVIVIAGKIFFLSFNRLTGPSTTLTLNAFALFIGLAALFLSYMLTDGLWLPLTWVFLGISMAHLRCFPALTKKGSAGKTETEPCA